MILLTMMSVEWYLNCTLLANLMHVKWLNMVDCNHTAVLTALCACTRQQFPTGCYMRKAHIECTD